MRFIDNDDGVIKRIGLAVIREFGDFVAIETVVINKFIFGFDHDVELGFELLAFFVGEIWEIVFCIFHINHPRAAVFFDHIGADI